ncbi:MAG: GNAT family N-acetyltransferase [Desulfuromonas sp.]|uniref:GNAT family N-acetyltransferase n=1 Tax=Desulfuromonas sp. TaxID=892 RepID=UPI000CBC9F5F|nr:GNAT family N-acetyltransferase [Desulfuromonas sp.]PLX86101.1 MAG: GNAT family N-acetyltransferase [Desulfuromonas sp.]
MPQIEVLARFHDRKSFDCGESALNDYLKETARQHVEKGISKTFVLIDPNMPKEILGYYTLASCEVVTSNLPADIAKKYPTRVPAAKLARLTVLRGQQRKGFGGVMMADAMKRILAIADNIGVVGFFVDAKNQPAKEYYEQYGFIPLPNNPLELFLPLATLRKAVEAAG